MAKGKKDFGKQLHNTLAQEGKALRQRFELPDKVLNEGGVLKARSAQKEICQTPPPPSPPPLVNQASSPSTSKVVRDTFSFPTDDYALIESLVRRAGRLEVRANRSEVLRAGLQVLSAMTNDDFSQALKQLAKIKPGRKNKRSEAELPDKILQLRNGIPGEHRFEIHKLPFGAWSLACYAPDETEGEKLVMGGQFPDEEYDQALEKGQRWYEDVLLGREESRG